jgi:hypothetical protein
VENKISRKKLHRYKNRTAKTGRRYKNAALRQASEAFPDRKILWESKTRGRRGLFQLIIIRKR